MEGLLRYRHWGLSGVVGFGVGVLAAFPMIVLGMLLGQGNFYLAELIAMAALIVITWRASEKRWDVALATIGGGLGIWTLVTLSAWQLDREIPNLQFTCLAIDVAIIALLVHRRGRTIGVRAVAGILLAALVVFTALYQLVRA